MAYLQLEALRQAVVGSAAGWQLASVRRYVAVGLSSCPFGSSSLDGLDDLVVPASRLLKEHSISSSSGEVDRDVLAELLVSGLEAFEDGCELLSDDVSDELNYQCHLYWCSLLYLSCQMVNWAKTLKTP